MKLAVNEIFYSLQGEGRRMGEASIFVRLTGCNLRCDFCDTSFETGTEMRPEEILEKIAAYACRWIVWTGGEPALQLSDKVLSFFKQNGYRQAIESNGTHRISPLLDYVACSPKGNYEEVKKINPVVDEIRLPVKAGDVLPFMWQLPRAGTYYISPIFTDDPRETASNIASCVDYVKRHPAWKLSLQVHKLIGIE
ncbi:MAG: 7-carboxy-7-deazaguanine synthase QueE [Dysgonamonadaceae bacterium]|jgi:organic radical activating enzyme|nr:7-carboxy-7-deazaguanine synthase QueE [Dysgonamonadaceae bacterium]